MHVRLGKALQTSASIRSRNGLGKALHVVGRQRPCGKHDHRVRGQVRDRPDRPKPTAEGMRESLRHKFCTASLDYAPLINGFVFAPPDRSILIQPSEVTRLVSIPNWLCLAPFRFLVPLSGNVWMRLCHQLAAVACYAATQAHPVLVIRQASAIWPPPSTICHSPPATLPAAPSGHTSSSFRVCRSHSAPIWATRSSVGQAFTAARRIVNNG